MLRQYHLGNEICGKKKIKKEKKEEANNGKKEKTSSAQQSVKELSFLKGLFNLNAAHFILGRAI